MWLPALAISTFVLNSDIRSFEALVQRGLSLTLVFFLTRTWLSEPNVNLILPMVLILASTGMVGWRRLHFLWIMLLVFTLLNASLPQLFFLSYPTAIDEMVKLDGQSYNFRVIARSLTAALWQIVGWRIAVKGSVMNERSISYLLRRRLLRSTL